jgi:DNA-binding NarL/FixJ family response regulator
VKSRTPQFLANFELETGLRPHHKICISCQVRNVSETLELFSGSGQFSCEQLPSPAVALAALDLREACPLIRVVPRACTGVSTRPTSAVVPGLCGVDAKKAREWLRLAALFACTLARFALRGYLVANYVVGAVTCACSCVAAGSTTAVVAALRRRFSEAEASLHAARAYAEAQGAPATIWRTQVALGRVFAAQRRRAEATEAFAAARACVEALAMTLVADNPLRQTFVNASAARLPRLRTESPRRAAKVAFGGLTPREREVAALIARARTNREIADALVVGERTVETHVENILSKLGLNSRREVVAWAIEHGLLVASNQISRTSVQNPP